MMSDTNQDITAGFHTMMEQAPMTAMQFIADMRWKLDAMFGPGWCERNPDAFARLCTMASSDFHASMTLLAGQKVAQALDRVADTIVQLQK